MKGKVTQIGRVILHPLLFSIVYDCQVETRPKLEARNSLLDCHMHDWDPNAWGIFFYLNKKLNEKCSSWDRQPFQCGLLASEVVA